MEGLNRELLLLPFNNTCFPLYCRLAIAPLHTDSSQPTTQKVTAIQIAKNLWGLIQSGALPARPADAAVLFANAAVLFANAAVLFANARLPKSGGRDIK
jgi:hypothetical protein